MSKRGVEGSVFLIWVFLNQSLNRVYRKPGLVVGLTYTQLFSTELLCTTICCTLQITAMHGTTLHCTKLQYNTLHCTTLHHRYFRNIFKEYIQINIKQSGNIITMLVTEAILISDLLPKMTWGSGRLGGVDSLPRSESFTGI